MKNYIYTLEEKIGLEETLKAECYQPISLFELDSILKKYLKTDKSIFDDVDDLHKIFEENLITYRQGNMVCQVHIDFVDIDELKSSSEEELHSICADVQHVDIL